MVELRIDEDWKARVELERLDLAIKLHLDRMFVSEDEITEDGSEKIHVLADRFGKRGQTIPEILATLSLSEKEWLVKSWNEIDRSEDA